MDSREFKLGGIDSFVNLVHQKRGEEQEVDAAASIQPYHAMCLGIRIPVMDPAKSSM